jgi:hypothetical protein
VIAILVTLMVAISPGLVTLSHWELSDVPFTAVTIAAMLAWRRVRDGEHREVVIAALLTLAAYSIRSAGLPLIVAGLALLAFRRRWKHLAIASAVMLPPAVAWAWMTGGQAGYFGQLFIKGAYGASSDSIGATEMIRRILENAGQYAGKFVPILVGGDASAPVLFVSLLMTAFAVFEWGARTFSRDRSVLELFTPLYVAMVLAWLPEFAGERLILPLYPFLLLYAALGVNERSQRAGKALRVGSALMPLGFALGVLGHGEADPGPGVWLVPIGALLSLYAVIAISRRLPTA